MSDKKLRNSNIELLRMISMFFVVISHYAVHSNFNFEDDYLPINRYYTLFTILGNAGVNIFVLVSSFFLSSRPVQVDSNNTLGIVLRYKKLFPIWRAMFLYSAILLPILIRTGLVEYNREDFVRSFSPVISEKWWFATTYIILFLLHPFINLFIDKIDNKTHLKIIALVSFIWVLIPTITSQKLKCNDVVWFVCLYLIAAYIKRNIDSFKGSSIRYTLFAFMFFLAYCASVVVIELLKKSLLPSLSLFPFYFSDKQSVIMVFLSVYLFLGFIKMKEYNSKIINVLASCTFGVYLISENPHMRRLIWTVWNPGFEYLDRSSFIPLSLGYCIVVYFACGLIEFIRLHTVEYVASRVFNPLEEQVLSFIRSVFQRISKLV